MALNDHLDEVAGVFEKEAPVDTLALERLSRSVSPDTYAPGARPYLEPNRPVIREQMNPLRRRHPDWPEEWYVRVPGTVYTWSAKEVGDGEPVIKAFPSADQAEEFAAAKWRERWQLSEESQIEVRRERVFPVLAQRPDEVRAFETFTRDHGGLGDVTLVTKGAPLDTTSLSGQTSTDWDLAEERQLKNIEAFERHVHPALHREDPRGPEPRLTPEGSERVAAFVHDARALWEESRDLHGPAGKTFRATLSQAVQVLQNNTYGAIDGGFDRGPTEFLKAMRAAEQVGKRLPGTDFQKHLTALSDRTIGLRSDAAGLYTVGTVPHGTVEDLESGYHPLTANLMSMAGEDSLWGATRLPSGNFALWRGRPDADGNLVPAAVIKGTFRDVRSMQYLTEGQPVTIVSDPAAIELWKRQASPVEIARHMTPKAEVIEKVPEPDRPTTRYTYHLAPFGKTAVVFTRDRWGLVDDQPCTLRDGKLVPMESGAFEKPVALGGESFAERFSRAKEKWPGIGALDLPPAVAKALSALRITPEAAGPRDLLWHVTPVSQEKPWTAVAWAREATADGSVLRTLGTGESHISRFVGDAPKDAVKVGIEALRSQGLAADGTRTLPVEVFAKAEKEHLRLQAEEATRRERLTAQEDPFEVLGRVSKTEAQKALRSVSDWAQPAARIAAVGLTPRDAHDLWGTDLEDAKRMFQKAETDLRRHFQENPEARFTEHRDLAPKGPSLSLSR